MQQERALGAPPPTFGGRGFDHVDTFKPVTTIRNQPDLAPVVVVGVIERWQRDVTHQRNTWAHGRLRLASGERVPFTVYPTVYAAHGALLVEGDQVAMFARVRLGNTHPLINVRALHRPERVTAAGELLTDDLVARYAAEAEAGYPLDKLTPRKAPP